MARDGAGLSIPMFAAVASLLLDVPTRAEVAAAGEITIRGTVLPVAGIKDKVEPIVKAERDAGNPGVRDVVYTGLTPVVYKAQRALLDGLIESWKHRRKALRECRILMPILEKESASQLASIALGVVNICKKLICIVETVPCDGGLSCAWVFWSRDEIASITQLQIQKVDRFLREIGAIGGNGSTKKARLERECCSQSCP